MPTIPFETTIISINSWPIIRLPKNASSKLPTRGQSIVEGKINGHVFQTPLEPDGTLSHWFKVDDNLRKAANVSVGDTVKVSMTPIKTWPEPNIPPDILKALTNTPKALSLWERITPLARWEWIRWIRSTKQSETRERRIKVACSKLTSGERRPCCWNRNLCTEPSVSHNGVLLDPN